MTSKQGIAKSILSVVIRKHTASDRGEISHMRECGNKLEKESETVNTANEEILTALLAQYKEINTKRAEACKMLDIQIENLNESRKAIACPYDTKIADIEMKIRLPMLDRATSFNCAAGKILYRKGAVRRSWNLDALDTVCAAKPVIKDAIWMFREEKTGEPSISIKVEV